MATYISEVKASLLNGIGTIDVSLNAGINFIAGENGTGKSRLLEFIKANTNNQSIVSTNNSTVIDSSRIAFYNPKRNAQKKDIIGLLQQLQRDGKTKQGFIAQLNQGYAEQFVEYPNFSDIFVTAVNDVIFSQNKTPNKAVSIVKKDFEKVIKAVLPYFEAEASWDTTTQQPKLTLKKYGHVINPSQISVGENETFALTFSIYSSKDSYDVYLIDEPEIHLNWSLEKHLFDFLETFAQKENKQVIVVTHSPVVFEDKFIDKTIFLTWDNGKIVISQKPNEDVINSLASRVANTIVKLDDSFDKTFFVEDLAHKYVVDAISKIKSKKIQTIVVGDRKKVVHWHETLKNTLSNAYFMVDGDNDEYNNRNLTGSLFALEKYCIENYLLDIDILTAISSTPSLKSRQALENHIIGKVKGSRDPEFKKRYLANIKLAEISPTEFFKIVDFMDGSQLVNNMKLYTDLGYTTLKLFIDAYINEAKTQRKLGRIFKEITSKLR